MVTRSLICAALAFALMGASIAGATGTATGASPAGVGPAQGQQGSKMPTQPVPSRPNRGI